MKIDRVQAFLVYNGNGHNVYIKVQTDDGFHGWGESFGRGERAEAVERHVQRMARHLLGRDPHHVKQFTEVMWLDYGGARGGFDLYTAISGLEIACWDIIGKAAGQPVYNLIGGACRPKVRVYANGWGGSGNAPLDVVAQQAQDTVARGYTALKFDPFPGPWRAFISAQDEQRAFDTVRVVREAVGPGVDLLIEVHRRLAPLIAIRFGRAIEQFNPWWYEEPTTTENLDALADVRSRVNIPTVAGEDIYTKFVYRQVLEKQAADILNPDVTACGGILGLKEISAMAEPYGVAISPHVFNAAVGFAANVQVSAAIPNFLITDHLQSSIAACAEVCINPLQAKDGYVDLPTSPGLGIELDEKALLARPFRDLAPRPIRTYLEERP